MYCTIRSSSSSHPHEEQNENKREKINKVNQMHIYGILNAIFFFWKHGGKKCRWRTRRHFLHVLHESVCTITYTLNNVFLYKHTTHKRVMLLNQSNNRVLTRCNMVTFQQQAICPYWKRKCSMMRHICLILTNHIFESPVCLDAQAIYIFYIIVYALFSLHDVRRFNKHNLP